MTAIARPRNTLMIATLVAAATNTAALAQVISVTYSEPTLDRWMYPFNADPGARASASLFGTFGEPDFDNRDAQMIVGFDTSGDVTPGLGASSYQIVSARLTLQNENDLGFVYDDTQDSYVAFLDPDDPDYEPDADPGQPLELYGLGFRNFFNPLTFLEDSPYTFGSPLGRGIRNAYAMDYDESDQPVDVSLNVEDRFDPTPWAVATIAGVTPGDFVPALSTIVFDVNVGDPNVQAYFRQSLDIGMLDLAVTSLTVVEVMEGDFSLLVCKENTLVDFGLASATRLELVVEIVEAPCPGDVDDSGTIGFDDLLVVLSTWGPCPGCPADVDGDGIVGFSDLLVVLSTWGPCE